MKKIIKTICDSVNHTRFPKDYQTERVGTTKLRRVIVLSTLTKDPIIIYAATPPPY